MARSSRSTNYAEAQMVRPAPRFPHVLGFGFYLLGDRDFDESSNSFVRTVCFCLFYFPVLALRSYRVVPSYEGWDYLARVPLARPAKVASYISGIALPGLTAALVGYSVWSLPANVASRAMAEAERLTTAGSLAEASRLLADVAKGPTDRAREASNRLAKLLDDPTSIRDIKGRGAAFRVAVDVQKAGRWYGSPQALHDSGVALAKDSASNDPVAAWEILDAVAPLASKEQKAAEDQFRHGLLEKIVAADRLNLEMSSKLAIDYEGRGDLDRVGKLLEPFRDQLGDGSAARALGLSDARANRLDRAIPLLRAYTKPRLARLSEAENLLETQAKLAQERIIRELERRRVPDFDYNRYRFATQDQQQQMLQDYVLGKMKNDPELSSLQGKVVAESEVIPIVLELGMILLQHAQAQGNPSARKALLDEAEASFLGVSRMAGDRADYQLSLAQVYYWQGKHDQGRALCDKVLTDHNREPALLFQVATLLRAIGDDTEARTLAEESYNKAPAGSLKEQSALLRAMLGQEVEDRITWFRCCKVDQPGIKAMLCSDLAEQALTRGEEAVAIDNLKQSVALYDAMPESASSLNNASIALMSLASLTGDPAAYDRAGTMIEKAVALDPGNSLTMANASRTLLEAGLRQVIGQEIDLRLIKASASVDILGFLARDESGRQSLVARVRSDPTVNRGLALADKVMLLSPKNPNSYRGSLHIHAYRGDADRLRAILERLKSTELDLGDDLSQIRELYSGSKDAKLRQAATSALARDEPILGPARAKGGPTLAVAIRGVMASRIATASLGADVDPDAMVALAEEAIAVSPSVSSEGLLVQALLFRSLHRLARSEPKIASLRDRFARLVSSEDIIAALLADGGPFQELAMKDSDLGRAIDLLRHRFAICPSMTAGPRSWTLVRARYPDLAHDMARTYFATETDVLEDEISGKLRPFHPTEVLKMYQIALMKGKPEEAASLLAEARSKGIPIPIEAP